MKQAGSMEQLPVGLGMALAQNVNAMQAFSRLDQRQQSALIQQAQNAKSRRDMEQLVSSLIS